MTGRDAFAAAPLERIEGATADLVFAGLLERWIHLAARRIGERRVWLTDLDAAIGDGDHGINLDRGMRELTARLDDGRLVIEPLGAGLEAAGRILMGTVGGASGALYGRGLMWAGRAIIRDGDVPAGAGGAAASPASGDASRGPRGDTPSGATTEHSRAPEPVPPAVATVSVALQAAVDGIAALGRSTTGQKTMLDALMPAGAVLRARASAGGDLPDALVAAADAAEAGAATTVGMLATRGRASYLGERSVGHLDPGAASSAILLRALADAARDR